jgi:hypothetical protein
MTLTLIMACSLYDKRRLVSGVDWNSALVCRVVQAGRAPQAEFNFPNLTTSPPRERQAATAISAQTWLNLAV